MDPHAEFENAISQSDAMSSETAPSPGDFVAARSLKRQLLAELRSQWEEGGPMPPENLLSGWPIDPPAEPNVAGVGRAEPGHGRRQPVLPSAGEELFGFHLCQEIGRGSYARVFLAEQQSLAGRPVVVKVSAIDGDEPQTLAQLQHTHIVPIYSLHEDSRSGLRLVCMPYFGGASLARLLEVLGAATSLPTHGRQLIAALRALCSPWSGPQAGAETSDRGPLALLASLSFLQAAAWIIARLAEALQHAHLRGILHRDIKPSNILLSADGQPMLLDFNLAENLQTACARAQASVGGTVAYMAPEQLRALARRDPALARQVDQRADLYGLGMVFYELLSGRSPFGHNAGYAPLPALLEAMAAERTRSTPSLRLVRPDAPWSLESIIRTCLAPDPADRYQQAEQLAEDLRRYLEDRPLRYAPELSWCERLGKWRRRHPRLALNGFLATAALLLLVAGSIVLCWALRRARAGEAAVAQQTKHAFLLDAQRARCFLNTTLGERRPLGDGLQACEKALRHYAVLQRPDWQARAQWQLLAAEEQRQVSEEIRELLLLLARARILTTVPSTLAATLASVGSASMPANGLIGAAAGQESQNATTAALEDGLALLERALALGEPGTARALWQDRTVYLESLGRFEEAQRARQQAEASPPATARDHYLLGSSYAHNGRYAQASAALKQALILNPRDYWSCFLLGICLREQADYVGAATEFRACIALWPEFSWGYFNLGEVLHHLGKRAEALEAYTMALQHQPRLAQAAFNRGLVCLDLSQWQQALEDFDRAEAQGWKEAALDGVRGIALAHLGRQQEADAAFARAWRSGSTDPELLLSYAFVISQRRPEEAREIFVRLLQHDPANARAMYGCGMLLEHQQRDSEEAAAWFSRALQRRPTFVEARLARALVRAHQGQWDTARQDMDLCLCLEPTGRTLYAAACFYALRAARSDPSAAAAWAATALALLDEALQQGYGHEQAGQDPDLDGIRHHPKFRRLLDAASKRKPAL